VGQRTRTLVLVILIVASVARFGAAGEGDEPQAPSCLTADTLTDNWLGAGEALSEKGVDFRLGLTAIYQLNLDGGLATHRRAGRSTGSFDLEAELDFQRLFGVPAAKLYALAEGSWSDGLDASSIGSVGGFEVNGDAGGDRSIDLTQLYYEQELLDGRLRFRVGKLDLTGGFECRHCPVAFDGNAFANDETAQFLNAALVNNPAIPFPSESLGAVVYAEPADGAYVSAGVADAQGDARETGFNTAFHDEDYFFSIFEFGLVPHLPGPRGPLRGGYRAGFWYDPQDKAKHAGGTKRDDVGFYLSCDQVLIKENPGEDDEQGLGVFGRYGLADGDVSEVRRFWSVGCQYLGLLPTRDEDVIAFGVAQGRLARAAGFGALHTTVMELYYNVQVTPWLNLSPSIQHVINPGGANASNHATVIGVRAQVAF